MDSNGRDISKYCRLCACETNPGFTIFDDSEDKASLDLLINKYLPIKVSCLSENFQTFMVLSP